MSEDDSTLAGSPSTESTFKTDGGLSTSAAPKPAIDASVKEAEEGPAAMEEARVRDVGFAPLEASTECSSGDGAPRPLLSEEFRQKIAKCLSNHGKVVGEIRDMKHATPAMRVSFERVAAVATANQICNIVEYEIEDKKF